MSKVKIENRHGIDVFVDANASPDERFSTSEEADEPFDDLTDATLEGLQRQIDTLYRKPKTVMRDGIMFDSGNYRYGDIGIYDAKVGAVKATRFRKGGEVWVTRKTGRSKEHAKMVYVKSPENLVKAEQYVALMKQREQLAEQAEALRNSMESFELKGGS